MKKEFIEKVLRDGIVDTKKYRYTLKDGNIMRLLLIYLDTTEAIDSWEVVVEGVIIWNITLW